MDKEKLHLKVGISGTYWDKKPQYRISFNDQVLKEGAIVSESDTVEQFEFDIDYSSEHSTLKIELLNKESSDTIETNDKTGIVKDMLLNIVDVEIDDIKLGQVLFEQSVYTPNTTVMWQGLETTTLKKCMNLGWNGAWTLTWSNPFYIWLLENM
jgi:hypothetical protein